MGFELPTFFMSNTDVSNMKTLRWDPKSLETENEKKWEEIRLNAAIEY